MSPGLHVQPPPHHSLCQPFPFTSQEHSRTPEPWVSTSHSLNRLMAGSHQWRSWIPASGKQLPEQSDVLAWHFRSLSLFCAPLSAQGLQTLSLAATLPYPPPKTSLGSCSCSAPPHPLRRRVSLQGGHQKREESTLDSSQSPQTEPRAPLVSW